MEMSPTHNSGWWLEFSPRHKMCEHGSMIVETQSRLLLYPVYACVAAHEWRALAAGLCGKWSENASTIPACKIAIQLVALTNHGKANYQKRTLENIDTPRRKGWATFMSTIYVFGENCGVKLSIQEHTVETQPCLASHKMFIDLT